MDKKKDKCERTDRRRSTQCPRCHGEAVVRGVLFECSECGDLEYRAITDWRPPSPPGERPSENAEGGTDLLDDLMALVARIESSS